MYKKFSIQEIKEIKNNFIPDLYSIIKKEKCNNINDFMKIIFDEWDDVYFFEKWSPFFKVSKKRKSLELTDEKEKIQLFIDIDKKSELNSLLNKYISKKEKQVWQRSIEQILFDEFKTWRYNAIMWKPYIVYDIETTVWVWDNLDSYEFLLAYAMYPWKEKMEYKYIDKESLKDFAKTLIEFDWYIIWFNSFAFDNPISIKQWWFWEKELDIINKKSLDIFYFIRNITWKRLWLNKMWEALIWIQKTLESWEEWEKLRKKYKKTWNLEFLEKFKKYCKNDVRMTAFILLYLLHFKKIFIEWEEKNFEIKDFIKLAKPKDKIEKEKTEEKFTDKSIF